MSDLEERIRIGIEADKFLHSKLGKYVQERAEIEIEDATEKLILADPEDLDKNVEYRRRIMQASDALDWLISAINDADQAKVEQLHEDIND